MLGPHDLKIGFEGRMHQMNYIQTNAPEGIFNFDTTGSAGCPYTYAECGGDSMASFMMGQVSLTTGSGYYEIQDRPATEDHQFAVYGQENWKVNPKLTLNLGLRWDVSIPRTDRLNRQNWFDPTATYSIGGIAAAGGEVFASASSATSSTPTSAIFSRALALPIWLARRRYCAADTASTIRSRATAQAASPRTVRRASTSRRT